MKFSRIIPSHLRNLLGQKPVNRDASSDLSKSETITRESEPLFGKIFHRGIELGDNSPKSTPFQRRIETNFNKAKINSALEELGYEKFSSVNAAKFFDEVAHYSSTFRDQPALNGSLIDFGVPDDYSGSEKLSSSLAHKRLVRKHLDETIKKPLPEDPDMRDKVISFQIFAFANADLLIGKLKYQKERYQSYVEAAVNNSNILPLIMMKEVAEISPKDAFSNKDAFKKLITQAQSKNTKIAEYLRNN